MIIYKITNKINGKVYIGQTVRTLEQRFERHKQDALSNRLDTHFARAIRKYGPENFEAEIIDTASTQEELTQKEHYWIGYYHSCEDGYNETDSLFKCGGNAYKNKTPEEMSIISSKIKQSKLGGKNPNAKKIKCKNIITGEELFFDSLSECRNFFQETNHNFVTRRCTGKTSCLYKEQWAFAYRNDEYQDFSIHKNSTRAQPIYVTDLVSNETLFFESYSAAERHYQITNRLFCSKAYLKDNTFIVGKYKITKIN